MGTAPRPINRSTASSGRTNGPQSTWLAYPRSRLYTSSTAYSGSQSRSTLARQFSRSSRLTTNRTAASQIRTVSSDSGIPSVTVHTMKAAASTDQPMRARRRRAAQEHSRRAAAGPPGETTPGEAGLSRLSWNSRAMSC